MDTNPQDTDQAPAGVEGLSAFYPSFNTKEAREAYRLRGYEDGKAGKPPADLGEAGILSESLSNAYASGHRAGVHETTPPPPKPIVPTRDYMPGIVFLDPDEQTPPTGVPILIRMAEGAAVAMAIVERDTPGEYRLFEGFDGTDWRHYESDDIDGWAHVYKPDAHAGNLLERRSEAAEAAYQDYDFGNIVLRSEGWETTIPSDETSRKVGVETDEADGAIEASFVVRFRPDSAEIAEAYAITRSGNIFGKPEEA